MFPCFKIRFGVTIFFVLFWFCSDWEYQQSSNLPGLLRQITGTPNLTTVAVLLVVLVVVVVVHVVVIATSAAVTVTVVVAVLYYSSFLRSCVVLCSVMSFIWKSEYPLTVAGSRLPCDLLQIHISIIWLHSNDNLKRKPTRRVVLFKENGLRHFHSLILHVYKKPKFSSFSRELFALSSNDRAHILISCYFQRKQTPAWIGVNNRFSYSRN